MRGVLTLRELLTDTTYKVSTYKRKYCWGDEHSSEMWNSVAEIVLKKTRATNNYMGTIICLNNGDIRNVELFDGQQRLVALSLLLGAVRINLLDDSENDILRQYLFNDEGGRITLNNEYDNDFYLRLLKEDEEAIDETDCRSLGSLAMWRTYEKYYRRTEPMGIGYNIALREAILDNLFFTVYMPNNSYEARKAIESINETGKKPSEYELLKLHLLIWIDENITDKNEAEDLKLEIGEIWDKADEYVFSGKLKSEDLDSFLDYLRDTNRKRICQNQVNNHNANPISEYTRNGYRELRLLLWCLNNNNNGKDRFRGILNRLKTQLDSFCVEVANRK